MAVTAVSGADVRRPVPRLRRLEDERWLAMALLFPTALLLGLFIGKFVGAAATDAARSIR